MNKELLNFYRERGNVPDIFYYQLNGKSAIDNYQEQRKKILAVLEENNDEVENV